MLDRLLEDGRVQVAGVCGTSAGAMNGVVMVDGWLAGGPDGARAALEAFWRRASLDGELRPIQRGLVDVARDFGADAHLIDNETEVDERWLEGKRVVGISSGASAPDVLVQRLVDFFKARGTEQVETLEVLREDVRFMLPKTIRQAMTARKDAAVEA